jgi:hypothetical protein
MLRPPNTNDVIHKLPAKTGQAPSLRTLTVFWSATWRIPGPARMVCRVTQPPNIAGPLCGIIWELQLASKYFVTNNIRELY